MNLVGIIVFIIVFGVLVLVHEAGHLILAKRAGILVREFSIGMGPKIFSMRDKTGTLYNVRILPLGGYVRMAGLAEEAPLEKGQQISLVLGESGEVVKINLNPERVIVDALPFTVVDFDLVDALEVRGYSPANPDETVTYKVARECYIVELNGDELLNAPREVMYDSASFFGKFTTNIAGPVGNFILGIVLFIILAFMTGTTPVYNTNQVGAVEHDMPAYKAGIREGDRIISIDGKKIESFSDISSIVQPKAGKALTFDVKGKGDIVIVPMKHTEKGESFGAIGVGVYSKKLSTLEKITSGFTTAWDQSLAIFRALGSLITHPNLNKLGGPVAIFQMSSDASKMGVAAVLYLMAMLSMNLGIINLIPIPAFDGGKIILNILEKIRRKPLSQKVELAVTLVGVVIIVILMVSVTFNDIMRLF
ncbi:MAG: RIP metalloprotease RseP [Lactobacillales bacterium]|jgi:regulator of sigma E protease|nr:RIP metalloprotease RseP [Lactobacillales bacterium]